MLPKILISPNALERMISSTHHGPHEANLLRQQPRSTPNRLNGPNPQRSPRLKSPERTQSALTPELERQKNAPLDLRRVRSRPIAGSARRFPKELAEGMVSDSKYLEVAEYTRGQIQSSVAIEDEAELDALDERYPGSHDADTLSPTTLDDDTTHAYRHRSRACRTFSVMFCVQT
jgi:hypothetical protein